jgi:hypothetical protein
MPDRQQDPESALQSTENSLSRLADADVPFRLIADFVVETATAAEFLKNPDLLPEQRDLFLILLTNPEARNRISRLAIVCDFSAHERGAYFNGVFSGPEPEQILDCVFPYLNPDSREYWTRLRDEERDYFFSIIDEVFLQFKSALKRVVIEDRSTGKEIPLRISHSACDEKEWSSDEWVWLGRE